MPYKPNDDEIGALWMKTSASGKHYMTGTVNGQPIVCFAVTKGSEKAPQWRILKATPKADRQTKRDDEDVFA